MSFCQSFAALRATDRSERYVDLAPLLERLRDGGWSEERLSKNDLVSRRNADGTVLSYASFWRTILRLTHEMDRLSLPPIFIKCVREYRYSDSNVDLLVPRSKLRKVAGHLCSAAWRTPTRRDAIEQFFIERAKLKLPSTDPEILAAHLYGGVSWRYQSDIGLLRLDSELANPAQLQRVTLAELASSVPELSQSDTQIWIPSDTVEFVLQAAHVAFENYRMTVGEAIHFRLLRERAVSSWEPALDLARHIGCLEALKMVDDESDRICTHLLDLNPDDYPRTLPLSVLLSAFTERAGYLRRSGRLIGALTEYTTTLSVYIAVSIIRRIRRLRQGAEGYRQ